MEQSSIFSFTAKFVLVHLSDVDISWSSKMVFSYANISLQISLKWFKERRWKVWEWEKMRQKNEDEEREEKESKKMGEVN